MADIIDRNRSYCNKDFQAIYEEMLELVPKLTSKWDPRTSDEADPGVALIKLMAILGDKLNYNIDKSILENFPLSVTQRKNARQLYDLIGYRMRWYKSALVDVSFRLNNSEIDTDVEIPMFTQITDDESKISFFTLENKTMFLKDLTTKYQLYPIKCMQGVIQDLKVNDSSEIRLSDLDENYRIYLPTTKIAENGIFIKEYGTDNYSFSEWKEVDNVEAYPLNSKIYTFVASDDMTQAYIQFPSDIASLLTQQGTLEIKYVITDGVNGNITSSILTTFSNDIYTINNEGNEVLVTDSIQIIQPSVAYYGADPETVEDAYRNSRKVIGTFNTLVTRLDYQNFIRRFNYDNGAPIVSNCVVADRTCDINQTYRCVKLYNFGTKVHIGNQIAPEVNGRAPATTLDAYDIVIYATSADSANYDSRFNPVNSSIVINLLENELAEVKCVNQDFLIPKSNGTHNIIKYFINNKYALTGQLVTTEKLSIDEAKELEDKVFMALQHHYKADNVDFGYPIDYELLIDRIRDCDSRIKSVALNPPNYEAYINDGNGPIPLNLFNMSTDPATPDYISEKIEIVAKTITAGNLQLFNFNKYFNKDFGQIALTSPSSQPENITSMILDVTVEEDEPHSLNLNESLQLLSPMYSVRTEYTVGCGIYLKHNSAQSLLKNQIVRLGTDDKLYIKYQDENSNIVTSSYGVGTIIQFNFNTVGYFDPSTDSIYGSTYMYRTLTSGQILNIIEKNSYPLKNKYFKLFLNRDIPSFSLLNEENNKNILILESNEYLIYTDYTKTQLMILGSGTSIELTGATRYILPVSDLAYKDLTIDDFNDFIWDNLNVEIKITENEILSFGQGMIIEPNFKISCLTEASTSPLEYKFSGWQQLADDQNIKIVSNTNDSPEPKIYDKNDYNDIYYYKMNVNLNNSDSYSILYPNQKLYYQCNEEISGEDFKGNNGIVLNNSNLISLDNNDDEQNINIAFNKPALVLSGIINRIKDEEKVLSIYSFTQSEDNSDLYSKNSIGVMSFDSKKDYCESITESITIDKYDIRDTNEEQKIIKLGSKYIELEFSFNFNVNKPLYYFIPININRKDSNNSEVVITIEKDNGEDNGEDIVKRYCVRDMNESNITTNVSGDYIIAIDSEFDGYNKLCIYFTKDDGLLSEDIVKVGKIYIAESYNEDEINSKLFELTNENKEKLIEKIREIATVRTNAGDYNWIYEVPEADKCIHPLESENFFNLNHPYNKYTIPQMDLDLYNIKVNAFSIRK